MLLLSDLDIRFLEVAVAGSVVSSVNQAVSHMNRKAIPPLIPEKKIRQQSSRNVTVPTKSIRQRLAQTQKQCVIFYGSQAGTAEKCASILFRETHARFGIDSLLANPASLDYDDLLSLREATLPSPFWPLMAKANQQTTPFRLTNIATHLGRTLTRPLQVSSVQLLGFEAAHTRSSIP
jgi:hypothetical protein